MKLKGVVRLKDQKKKWSNLERIIMKVREKRAFMQK